LAAYHSASLWILYNWSVLPTSDIDLVVFGDVGDTIAALFALAEHICEEGLCEVEDMTVLAQARVPIIHFIDAKTRCGVDVSINVNVGVMHTSLIKNYLQQFKPLKPLLLVLKFFLHQHALNEPYTGGLGSYGLTLMLVNFLQLSCQNLELPSKEKETEGSKVDPLLKDNNCGDENLGDLLMRFLCFYGKDFDFFRNVISVHNGRCLPKIDNSEWWATPWIPVIADPLFPENNVARTTYKICEIKQAFYEAFVTLRVYTERNTDNTNTEPEPILASILYISPDLVKYRRHISCLYPTSKPKHVKYHKYRQNVQIHKQETRQVRNDQREERSSEEQCLVEAS